MIASPGKQLLQWVNDYIYPAEEAFADEAHARAVASVFCDELIRNGTTTACVYWLSIRSRSMHCFRKR